MWLSFLGVQKGVTKLAISIVNGTIGGFGWSDKKVERAKIKGCGAYFTSLRGLRGGFMVGVYLDKRYEIDDFWSW